MHPQVIDRIVQEPRFQANRLLHEPARRNYLVQDEPRLKRGKVKPFLVGLCSVQHKRTYVVLRIMLRRGLVRSVHPTVGSLYAT
jgi:hypothetical protein